LARAGRALAGQDSGLREFAVFQLFRFPGAGVDEAARVGPVADFEGFGPHALWGVFRSTFIVTRTPRPGAVSTLKSVFAFSLKV
jgi:hypothetical protein